MTGHDLDTFQPPLPGEIASLDADRTVGATRRLSSEHLFGGQVEIEIVHGTLVYRLRRTSLGKLILTK